MAFKTAQSNIKTSILNFVKNLLTKTQTKALDIILSPCCNIEITDVTYDCGTEEVLITISPAQPSFYNFGGFAQGFYGEVTSTFLGAGTISSDGTTITIPVALADAPVGETVFSTTLFLPTNQSNSTTGVYQIASGVVTAIPAC